MPKDYIPDPDADFAPFAKKATEFLAGNFDDLGVNEADSIALTALHTTWKTKYQAKLDYDAAGNGVTVAKNDAREAWEATARPLLAQIQNRVATTNTHRTSLGLPIHDTTATAAPVPSTRPVVVKVDRNTRLSHILHWRDEATPESKAKPKGVARTILHLKIGGAAPVDLSETDEVAQDTATPYLYEFAGADAGKMAHWILQWENTRGERGPISATTSETIAG